MSTDTEALTDRTTCPSWCAGASHDANGHHYHESAEIYVGPAEAYLSTGTITGDVELFVAVEGDGAVSLEDALEFAAAIVELCDRAEPPEPSVDLECGQVVVRDAQRRVRGLFSPFATARRPAELLVALIEEAKGKETT